MIHFVTPYGRRGPSSRVRVFEWLDRLQSPHTLTSYISAPNSSPSTLVRRPVAVAGAERRLRRLARRPESVFLHREASPLSRGALERRLLSASAFSVYDFDDALQWDKGEGAWFRRLAPKAAKAELAVQNADRVIAGNAVLADWASLHNPDVVVIPSCVSHAAYEQKVDYSVADPPRLVWIGSRDNEIYLSMIAGALHEVHRRTGARLTLIGTIERRLGDLEQMIDRIPWSEHAQHSLLASFDLAIAPLADEAYTRGKCGYKLLQYAAAGLPIVGSPIGVNEEILAHLGLPAPTNESEWTEAMLDLLALGAAARERLGRGARAFVEREYSYDAWLPRWLQATGLDRSTATREEQVVGT